MSWFEKVAERLDPAGLLFLIAGAAVCFGADFLTSRVKTSDPDKTRIILKLSGLALAVIGALILLDF